MLLLVQSLLLLLFSHPSQKMNLEATSKHDTVKIYFVAVVVVVVSLAIAVVSLCCFCQDSVVTHGTRTLSE